jgi:hypothetical protein
LAIAWLIERQGDPPDPQLALSVPEVWVHTVAA